jgi:hypothetical protein
VGRILLKDVVSDEKKPGRWCGRVYAERLQEYKDAEITLPEPDRMQIKVKVGFESRTVLDPRCCRADGVSGRRPKVASSAGTAANEPSRDESEKTGSAGHAPASSVSTSSLPSVSESHRARSRREGRQW